MHQTHGYTPHTQAVSLHPPPTLPPSSPNRGQTVEHTGPPWAPPRQPLTTQRSPLHTQQKSGKSNPCLVVGVPAGGTGVRAPQPTYTAARPSYSEPREISQGWLPPPATSEHVAPTPHPHTQPHTAPTAGLHTPHTHPRHAKRSPTFLPTHPSVGKLESTQDHRGPLHNSRRPPKGHPAHARKIGEIQPLFGAQSNTAGAVARRSTQVTQCSEQFQYNVYTPANHIFQPTQPHSASSHPHSCTHTHTSVAHTHTHTSTHNSWPHTPPPTPTAETQLGKHAVTPANHNLQLNPPHTHATTDSPHTHVSHTATHTATTAT